jgi:3-hydroxymyristoyl/3-hydroxydecanoyl-(acyl carrier protein) dehydratase
LIFPTILSCKEEGDTRRFELDISPELLWFRGHFAGFPILPGVVQLRWAVELSQQHFGLTSSPQEVMRLKFKSVVIPPLVIELSITRLDETAIRFKYSGQGQEYSQGKLIFREAGQ